MFNVCGKTIDESIEYFFDFEVYGKYITSAPARSCIAAAALPKGALAEVEVIAKLK